MCAPSLRVWPMQGLENRGEAGEAERSVGNVGRLDAQTSGALLVTDDGTLHHLLTRPGSVWKVYQARVSASRSLRPPTTVKQLRIGWDCSPCRGLLTRRDLSGVVHHFRAIFCRPVPNPMFGVGGLQVWPAIGADDAALDALRRGVQLDGAASAPTLPARVDVVPQTHHDDEPGTSDTTVLRISLQQGQYRQVCTALKPPYSAYSWVC